MDYLSEQIWQDIAVTQKDKFNNQCLQELFALDFDSRNTLLDAFYNKQTQYYDHYEISAAINIFPIFFEQTAILNYIQTTESIELFKILGVLPYTEILDLINFFTLDKHLNQTQKGNCKAYLINGFKLFDDLTPDTYFKDDLERINTSIGNFLDSI